jgi:hypothetical protein
MQQVAKGLRIEDSLPGKILFKGHIFSTKIYFRER